MIRRKIPKVGDHVEVKVRGSEEWIRGICDRVSSEYVFILLEKERPMTYSERELQNFMKTNPDLRREEIYKSQCATSIRILEEK